MADLGFWNQAQANPERRILVGPDGTELSAGELMASANRPSFIFAIACHALSAVSTPNPAPRSEVPSPSRLWP